MKCVACGDHPLNYIHCDRWDCPLLLVRAEIEGGGKLYIHEVGRRFGSALPQSPDEAGDDED